MKLFNRLFNRTRRFALVCVRTNGTFVRATIESIKDGKLSTLLSFDNEEEAIRKYNELIAD